MLSGMGVAMPLPVPRMAIESHARRVGVEEYQLDQFVEIVAALDDHDVAMIAERMAADSKKTTGKGGRHGQ